MFVELKSAKTNTMSPWRKKKTKWNPSASKSLHIVTQIYYNVFANLTESFCFGKSPFLTGFLLVTLVPLRDVPAMVRTITAACLVMISSDS